MKSSLQGFLWNFQKPSEEVPRLTRFSVELSETGTSSLSEEKPSRSLLWNFQRHCIDFSSRKTSKMRRVSALVSWSLPVLAAWLWPWVAGSPSLPVPVPVPCSWSLGLLLWLSLCSWSWAAPGFLVGDVPRTDPFLLFCRGCSPWRHAFWAGTPFFPAWYFGPYCRPFLPLTPLMMDNTKEISRHCTVLQPRRFLQSSFPIFFTFMWT